LNKTLKIVVSVFLLAVIIFAAVPKVYIHDLMGHTHKAVEQSDALMFRKDNDTRDCNFEKFDTPVYYTVFKFIINILPVQSPRETSFRYTPDSIIRLPHEHVCLRGPPAA